MYLRHLDLPPPVAAHLVPAYSQTAPARPMTTRGSGPAKRPGHGGQGSRAVPAGMRSAVPQPGFRCSCRRMRAEPGRRPAGVQRPGPTGSSQQDGDVVLCTQIGNLRVRHTCYLRSLAKGALPKPSSIRPRAPSWTRKLPAAMGVPVGADAVPRRRLVQPPHRGGFGRAVSSSESESARRPTSAPCP